MFFLCRDPGNLGNFLKFVNAGKYDIKNIIKREYKISRMPKIE